MNAVFELITRDARLPTARAVYRAGATTGLLITAYLIWETLDRWPEHSTIGGAT